MVKKPTHKKRKGGFLRRFLLFVLMAALAAACLLFVCLVMLRVVDPVTTGVQMQRRVEALVHGRAYTKRYTFQPLWRISPDLQHAVIAAEDGRFHEHHGIDWKQVRRVVEESQEAGKLTRGASTITQQLMKNLFFTTHRNPVRKAAEYVLAPAAEVILGKQRILELYLNVIEWGDGIYGAEAASRAYYRQSSEHLTRAESAKLAALLPAPGRRSTSRVTQESVVILQRMKQMGW